VSSWSFLALLCGKKMKGIVPTCVNGRILLLLSPLHHHQQQSSALINFHTHPPSLPFSQPTINSPPPISHSLSLRLTKKRGGGKKGKEKKRPKPKPKPKQNQKSKENQPTTTLFLTLLCIQALWFLLHSSLQNPNSLITITIPYASLVLFHSPQSFAPETHKDPPPNGTATHSS